MRHFILYCLLLIPLYCTAQLPLDQQQYADSLTLVLRHTRDDSVKAKTHFLLTYYWLSHDTLKAKAHLNAGRLLSRMYPYLEAISYAHEGYFYYNTNLDNSEAAYLKADARLAKYTTKEAYTIRSNIWNNIAVIQQRKDDDKGFISMLLNRAIPLAKLAQDSALTATKYSALALALMNTEQYDKAEVYFNEAISMLRQSHGQPSRLVATYNRAGENLLYLGKLQAAHAMLDSIEKMLAPYPGSELYAGYYQTEGMYYHQLKQYTAAVGSFDKAIDAASGPNKDYQVQEIRILKVRSLIDGKQFNPAIRILNQLMADEDAMSLDENKLGFWSALAECYAATGNKAMAYTWQRMYSQLSDSLNKRRLKEDINDLEAKYRNSEQRKKIALLEVEKRTVALAANNHRLANSLLAAASLLLLIIAIFTTFYYRSAKRLSRQKEINYQQQLGALEQHQQLSITHAMLQGEEQERGRIARDLHDGLGGSLAGLKMDISRITSQPRMETFVQEQLQSVAVQLDGSVDELRRIARNLMPEALLKFGLFPALKDFCEGLDSDATRIFFQSSVIDDTGIEPGAQLMVYRIVQELVTNALKHAQAKSILVDCIQNGQQIAITVEDDGAGFDMAATGRKGMGLSNVHARVRFLKGKINIHSVKGTGTTVNIQFDKFEKDNLSLNS